MNARFEGTDVGRRFSIESLQCCVTSLRTIRSREGISPDRSKQCDDAILHLRQVLSEADAYNRDELYGFIRVYSKICDELKH